MEIQDCISRRPRVCGTNRRDHYYEDPRNESCFRRAGALSAGHDHPNAPVILFAAGQPYQVKNQFAGDHLLIRLRWGTPPELRRLSLLQLASTSGAFRKPRRRRAISKSHRRHRATPQQHKFHRANPPLRFSRTKFFRWASSSVRRMIFRQHHLFLRDNGHPTLHTNFNAATSFIIYQPRAILLGAMDSLRPTLTIACPRLPPSPPDDVRVENTVLPARPIIAPAGRLDAKHERRPTP